MESSTVRILLVEDFEPFRILIRTILAQKPGLHIIAEVSDGLEAVQKAVELKPHLILLDIGLPFLSGFDAARLIRKLAPDSRILFVSQEPGPEVVQEALSLGASGYVVKTRLASDLLPAVEAVLAGRNFFSGK
jgi:two-component system, NarL family, response regulator NreC